MLEKCMLLANILNHRKQNKVNSQCRKTGLLAQGYLGWEGLKHFGTPSLCRGLDKQRFGYWKKRHINKECILFLLILQNV